MDGCETDVIAARICGDLDLNGYSDWYLPSKDELHKLYLNIGPAAPAPNTNIGGFTDASYWSSSEYDANYAWTFLFPYGDVYFTFKSSEFYVRAVRSF